MKRLAPFVVAAIAAAYFASFVTYGINLEDEGTILYQIARTLGGQLPYVDFETGYTPGVFYLNAALLHLFGVSVVPLRIALVAVNAATVALVFVLARPLAGGALAAAAALGYAAFLPFFVGEFASFNIPYPAWYAGLLWLTTQWAFDRHLERGGRGALFGAGLAAGLAFTFKPNSGVLAVLACGLTLAMLAAGEGDDDARGARLLLGLGLAALVVLLAQALAVLLTLEDVTLDFPLIAGAPIALVLGRMLRARRRTTHAQRLWPAVGLVALGATLTTVPWIAFFLARLGVHGFLHDVLLFGSGAERIYATPYPLPLGFPGGWAVLAAVTLVAAGALGLAAERGRVRVGHAVFWTGLVALLVALLLWRLARMPEGLRRSVLWQAQQLGFFLVPPLAVAMVVRTIGRLRAPGPPLDGRERRLLGALVFALLMYVQLYPRIDTMHLIVAIPSALVLGAGAAARLARAWAGVLAVPRRRVVGALAAAAGALAVLSAIPNYQALVGPEGRHPQTALASTATPVHVEAARDEDVRALNAVLAHLRAKLAPGEPVFGFPATALVSFALDLPASASRDYFFPGRPDHRAEAEVVRALAAAPPRYVVTLNRRLGFFMEAPAYYFILREFVRQHYELVARYGRYDILARRPAAAEAVLAEAPEAAAPAAEPEPLFAALADPDRDIRRAATHVFLAHAGGPAGVEPLAAAWAPDDARRLLLMRNLGESGDVRSLDLLADVFEHATLRPSAEAASALTLLAMRARADRYLFGLDADGPDAVAAAAPRLDRTQLVAWLGNPKQRRLVGVFAARALATAGEPAVVPALETVMRDEKRIALRVAAAEVLVRLGRFEHLDEMVGVLGIQKHEVQDVVPSALIEIGRAHPAEVGAELARMLVEGNSLARETSAWIAGAMPAAAAGPALRRALEDPAVEVRIAAAWAVGRLRDVPAREALVRLADHPDPELREFVREALSRLGAVS